MARDHTSLLPWLLVAGLGFAAALVLDRQEAPRPAGSGGEPGQGRATDARDIRRAVEPGRGRQATSPWEIPWRGWRDILLRTYQEFNEDRMQLVAAGVVFFLLLAIFPTITALVSLYALFADTGAIHDALEAAAGIMPCDAFELLRGEVDRIAAKGSGSLGLTSAFGILFALWSANAGTKALFDAINVAYGETEKRGFIRLNLVSLAFTIGAIVFLLVAVAAVIVAPLVLGSLGFLDTGVRIIALLRWPILFILAVAALSLLYRYGPSRNQAKWRWLTVGSAVATFLWLVASVLYSTYLTHFTDYSATYGSLGAIIGLMMWLWLSVIAVLAGAELDAEIEHQTARDSTVGAEKPLGVRGATMADTVGKAQAEDRSEPPAGIGVQYRSALEPSGVTHEFATR